MESMIILLIRYLFFKKVNEAYLCSQCLRDSKRKEIIKLNKFLDSKNKESPMNINPLYKAQMKYK